MSVLAGRFAKLGLTLARLELAQRPPEALDPVLLAVAAGTPPDPWQEGVLHSTAPRLLLNCCRQSGKSTITAVLAVHQAVYTSASLVLLVSPTQRQSGELFRKCLQVYRSLGRPIPSESETALSLELENGSRIVSLPGKEGTIRGFSGVSLLAVDEAAWVPDDLYHAVSPMLAVSGGRMIVLSTPHGQRGFFHEAYVNGGADWARVEVPATDCPRISAAFLEQERRTLGPHIFAAEYECQFTANELSVFRPDDVQALFDEDVAAWDLSA